MTADTSQPRPIDWVIFLLAPLCFATNIIFGRGVIGEISPFTTAFIRWTASALIMAPFVYADRKACIAFVRNHSLLWLVIGFLGMGICGGVVYWSLTYTSAANGTLIYTTSALFIIIFQRLFQNRPIRLLEVAGMIIAFAGVGVIVLKGNLDALLHLDFNLGDFGILMAAIAFAVYSLLLRKREVNVMKSFSLFGLIAASGALVLLPMTVVEFAQGGSLPVTATAWLKMGGIILIASLAAFLCFTHTVRVFGPTTAGVTLYLMPPISIVLAWLFLAETFETYHGMGIVLVMSGVILATAPTGRRLKGPKTGNT